MRVVGTVVLWVSALAAPLAVRAQGQRLKHAPSAAALSPAFKAQAWKALDALQRVSGTVNSAEMDATTKGLLVDADKAVDNAKYEATTPLDKSVLRALQMASLALADAASAEVSEPRWRVSADRAFQCETEATYYITPDQLSEKGKASALLGTCNKKTFEWDSGITH